VRFAHERVVAQVRLHAARRDLRAQAFELDEQRMVDVRPQLGTTTELGTT